MGKSAQKQIKATKEVAKPVASCPFVKHRVLSKEKDSLNWGFEAYEGEVTVDPAEVRAAVNAILKVSETMASEQKMLFDENSRSVTLTFGLSGIPKHFEARPYYIEVPNPLFNDQSEVILFTRDPQRKFKDLLDANPVPAIKKVLGVKKLKQRYQTVQQKKELASTYELFLCDSKVFHAIHGYCGREIIRKHWPVPVVLSSVNTQERIQKVLNCTFFRTPTGPCINVKIGRGDWDAEKLVQNVAAVLPRVCQVIESKHQLKVNAISLSATDCPSLPIYARTTVDTLVAAPVKTKAAKKATPVAPAPTGAVAPASDSEDELVPAAAPVKVTKVEKVSKADAAKQKTKAAKAKKAQSKK